MRKRNHGLGYKPTPKHGTRGWWAAGFGLTVGIVGTGGLLMVGGAGLIIGNLAKNATIEALGACLLLLFFCIMVNLWNRGDI